jgi:hypothetical protein
VEPKSTTNTQNKIATISARYIRMILAHANTSKLFLAKQLLVMRKPLVTKNTSTATLPRVMPTILLNGSASVEPLSNSKTMAK